MLFISDKYKVVIFGKTNDTSHLYTHGDTTLKAVTETKYLGVTAFMQSNLKFNKHITFKVNNPS